MKRLFQFELLSLLRADHWVKNTAVLLPVIFGMRMSDPVAWVWALMAASAFCLASSCCYILNDLADAESDRGHPSKKDRPIAAGRVSVQRASIVALILFVASLGLARSVSMLVFLILAAYLLLQAAYTYVLKHRVLLDVICIAIGFVLRAACGAVAIKVAISPWLFICMFTICLFMGFCKRYTEIITLGDMAEAKNHRATLIVYTPELLTHLITVSAGIAVVSFLMYGLNDATVGRLGGPWFVYPLPVVTYAVFRFAMLSMKGSYHDPTSLILHDTPFQVAVVLWMGLAVMIIIFGQQFANWLETLN